MRHLVRRWGGICFLLGSVLMAGGNVLYESGLVTGSPFVHTLVLWGHGLLAAGALGLAESVVNSEVRIRVSGATVLFVFANVLLGAGIGLLILQSGGQITSNLDSLMGENTWLGINLLVAHYGYVIGLLLLLIPALAAAAHANANLYLFMAGTILVGVGPFGPPAIFTVGFAVSLLSGVWLGKELIDSAGAAAG